MKGSKSEDTWRQSKDRLIWFEERGHKPRQQITAMSRSVQGNRVSFCWFLRNKAQWFHWFQFQKLIKESALQNCTMVFFYLIPKCILTCTTVLYSTCTKLIQILAAGNSTLFYRCNRNWPAAAAWQPGRITLKKAYITSTRLLVKKKRTWKSLLKNVFLQIYVTWRSFSWAVFVETKLVKDELEWGVELSNDV